MSIWVGTALPRVVLQTAFVAYLGYYTGGATGREFAFVGACVQVVVTSTVVRAPAIVVEERVTGTLSRLRVGVLPVPAVLATRWWTSIVEATAAAAIAVAAVGPAIGEAEAVPRLLVALPLFLLVSVTTSALGLAVTAVALSQRADVLLTNLVSYLLLAVCGVVAPLGTLGHVGAAVVRFLPLTNGLLAVRHVESGGAWLGDAGLELAAGLGWLLVGVGLVALQGRRARTHGTDDRI